jgi:hypothetical protein
MDPIFANFSLAAGSGDSAKIQRGLPVKLTSDALPGETIKGSITAVNPASGRSATRNIRVQATRGQHPVSGPAPRHVRQCGPWYCLIPILYWCSPVLPPPSCMRPYSDSVFVVEDKPSDTGVSSGKRDAPPAIRPPGRKAGGLYHRTLRHQGRRDCGEYRCVQVAQRPGSRGGQHTVS